MNRSLIVAVLTVTMIMAMSTAVYALADQHNTACNNCHGKFLAATAEGATNGCVACHSAMGESLKPINPGDMSNYFDYVTGQPASGSKSTHTYLGQTVYSPNKANTREPQTSAMTPGAGTHNGFVSLTNKLTCNRCHFAPGQNTYKPFLRMTNVDDAMCFDCHYNRTIAIDTTLNNIGSHPVAYKSYSAVYKFGTNSTAFRRTPANANPYNRTSNLGNYFDTKGRVVCSTCHGVHFADSNSSTLDNFSTANGSAVDVPDKGLKGSLQLSNGALLRTDLYGSTAGAINLCSSCHKETRNMNHNGKGQNVQCSHCHSAHVDYTAGDTGPKNIYLVRRNFANVSISTGKLGANVTAIYNSTTTAKFKRADGKGICQACHATFPSDIAVHTNEVTTKADCTDCHKHSDGFSPSGCTSCHGQPPITNQATGPYGKASASYALDESLTAHATHASGGYYNYACKNCHYDGTDATHNTLPTTGTATFANVFVNTTGSVGSRVGVKNVPSDYNPAARTCANVYCHSNGKPRVAGIAWKSSTPGWESGKFQIIGQTSECTTCHDKDTISTNAHLKHVGVSYNSIKCYVCHSATVNLKTAVIDRTKHVNGTKDVSFPVRPDNFMGPFEASFNTSNASCTNTCHSDGKGTFKTAIWTDPSTGACGTCHATAPPTDAHFIHFTSATGPKLGKTSTACSNCHTYGPGTTTHANSQIDLNPGGCTPCHPGTSPLWLNNAKVSCDSCHAGNTASVVSGRTAPFKVLNSTVGHGQYSTAATARIVCTTCHSATANHINAGPAEKRLLIAGNNLCDSCHTTASGKGLPATRLDYPVHGGTTDALSHYSSSRFTNYTTPEHLTDINTTRSNQCSGCHDTHGTTNKHNVRTTINGLSVSYKSWTGLYTLTKNVDNKYTGLCQVCHTKTKYYRNYTTPNSHFTEDCLSCHSHKDTPDKKVTFAFMPLGGKCGSCHGYPPVRDITNMGTITNYSSAKLQDYSGGGGAHSVKGHVLKTVRQDESWVNCSSCHYNQESTHKTGGSTILKSNINVVVDPQFKFNNTSTIRYNNSTCSNVSCHFKRTPNWTNGL